MEFKVYSMKVVILCGGLGTRLREETEFRPKPMVPVGGRPMLWHFMKYYAHFGHKDFILCLGYKGEVICFGTFVQKLFADIRDVTGVRPTVKGVQRDGAWT